MTPTIPLLPEFNAPRYGRYRLSKRCHFARVAVSVFLAAHSENEIIDATQAEPHDPQGRVDAKSDPYWLAGAVEGVSQAFGLLKSHFPDVLPLRVRIDEVIGLMVDTDPNDVAAAATMAVLNALGLDAFAKLDHDAAGGLFIIVLEIDVDSASSHD